MDIRLATPEDAAGVLEIYGPFCATPVSFEAQAPAVGEIRRRIAKTLERLPWLVAAEAGVILGYAYAKPHREREAYQWSVELSIYVREGCRRQGVGRVLYGSLLAILRLQGYYNAYAGTTLPNPASVALHEAVGFRPVGVYHGVGFKYGAWHDVGWYELALRPRKDCPAGPPLSLAEVRQHPEWEAALASRLRSRA